MSSLFDEFVGQEVKAPYRDGAQFKIARGVLESINGGFVKISGRLGTIIINEKNIETSEIATRNLPTSVRSKRAISDCAQKHAPHFSAGSVFDKMSLVKSR